MPHSPALAIMKDQEGTHTLASVTLHPIGGSTTNSWLTIELSVDILQLLLAPLLMEVVQWSVPRCGTDTHKR